jgi:UDP-glucose 4-epimerase
MNWNARKVLITGADGFIGSHLAEALVGAGAEVTALALYNSFDSHGWLDDVAPEILDDLRLVRGDIRDGQQLAALVRGQDIVFHLAALIAIPYSYDAPTSYVQTNVQGTVNVLTAARDGGVSRIIHTSTSEVYGTAQFTPIPEDHPIQGQSPYSASKIAADMMAEAFHRSFGLPVITVRPFNTYGPRQSERAVISTIIRQALDERTPEMRLGDLTPTRDFNFVKDTVTAFIRTAELNDSNLGRVFNTGSGHMISIQEVVDMVRRMTGCDKPVVVEDARKRPPESEVMALMADASRLEEASGWMAETCLEDGLGQTIDWWRERMDWVRADIGFMS